MLDVEAFCGIAAIFDLVDKFGSVHIRIVVGILFVAVGILVAGILVGGLLVAGILDSAGELDDFIVEVDGFKVVWGKYNSGHFTAQARFMMYEFPSVDLQEFLQKNIRIGSSKPKPNLGSSIPSSRICSCMYNNKNKK